MSAAAIDDVTECIILELPASKIVFIHALFEGYDGLAQVKTLDTKRSLLCLIATRDTAPDCLRVLESLRGEVAWRQVAPPENFDELFDRAQAVAE